MVVGHSDIVDEHANFQTLDLLLDARINLVGCKAEVDVDDPGLDVIFSFCLATAHR